MEAFGSVYWNRGHMCDSVAEARWLTRLRLLSVGGQRVECWEVLPKTCRSTPETLEQQPFNSYWQRAGSHFALAACCHCCCYCCCHRRCSCCCMAIKKCKWQSGSKLVPAFPVSYYRIVLKGTFYIVLNLWCNTHFKHLLSVFHILVLRGKKTRFLFIFYFFLLFILFTLFRHIL